MKDSKWLLIWTDFLTGAEFIVEKNSDLQF